MQSWRCKCGECLYSESGMPPKDCQGCKKCGTTYAQHPDGHKPLQPHALEQRYDTKTGKPSHFMCTECYQRVKQEQTA